MLKRTISEIKQKVSQVNSNIEILSTIYKNNKNGLRCKCLIDGHIWKATASNLIKGCGCPKCKATNQGNRTRRKIEDAYLAFELKEYIPMFKEYKNSHERLDAKTKDGYTISISYGHLIKNKKPNIFGAGNVHTLSNIGIYLKNNCPGYKLISKEFISATNKLRFECDAGHLFDMAWNGIQQGRRCSICFGVKKKTTEIFRKEISDIVGDEYALVGEYSRDNIHVNLIHNKCGNKYRVTPSHFIQGKRCPKCAIRFGERNNKYNPLLTDEDRIKRRVFMAESQSKWRKNVFERDGYSCVACNTKGKTLNAHHLDGYHWCKEKRFDIENGTTLCKVCHKDFHKTYGSYNNTKKQFEEFLLRKENYND